MAIRRNSSRSDVTETPKDAPHRTFFVNQPQTTKFCNNHITTAKYNVLTFVPSFLFEQFRRYSNCFFLFIVLLQQIPDVSPTGRYTTVVPLMFILSVSAVKEIVEDFKRHRADGAINNRYVEVLKGGVWIKVKWIHVAVGDIVKVHKDNFFPADLIILASSEPQSMCYVETSNLDGETNLKVRQGLKETSRLVRVSDLAKFRAQVDCEMPNRHLYEFTGVLHETGHPTLPLGVTQMLLRGAMLRNTAWVHGLVVYTGHETKLMKNTTRAPLKRSTVDKATNSQILMLFVILVVLCLLAATFNELWRAINIPQHSYVGIDDVVNINFGFNLLTFMILFNNLIPISLQVTLEVVRFMQATFINMDVDMYDEVSDTPAMARTSNLNEELGQIQYVFSDKTGTLTRNVMDFKAISIAGTIHTPEGATHVTRSLTAENPDAQAIREFLVMMSVCHTVIPERGDWGDEIIYNAASPDERALVRGACVFGYVFDSRSPTHVEIVALGVRERYEILNVLEFTSARKRMSVLARTPAGEIKLFCKGADNVIYERLSATDEGYRDVTLKQLEDFAKDGLRTLCFAARDVTSVEYAGWKKKHDRAAMALQNREGKLEEVAELIEKDMALLGASAIEDKLQDQVPETIAALLLAGIRVWVLTGDKQETAINIGYSCRLISQGTPLLLLNEDSLDATGATIRRQALSLSPTAPPSALVVDGRTLKYALSCALRREFLDLCVHCTVVICCRVSPLQKAEVVDLVTVHTKAITLAIGDGANDVAMIQKANVGVGISGVEGLQAACASDYSIAQFRFLLKLLLVHGAWNYNRMCKVILYSFYKNICLYVIELWFATYSGWSGQILFERWTIGLYNVLFTAMPPLAMGLFDMTCSAETTLRHPPLYRCSQSGRMFGVRVFWEWIFTALLHSALLYWLPYFAVHGDIVWAHAKSGGYLILGNFVYTYVVVTVSIKAGLVINAWTWITHVAIWGSIVAWFIFVIIYSHVAIVLPVGEEMLGMDRMLFSSPVFWLGLVLVPLASLLIDVTCAVVQVTAFTQPETAAREIEIKDSERFVRSEKDKRREVKDKRHWC